MDPYADLLKNFNGRRSDYLRRLTTDDATFQQDPVANGTAGRRGFLKGQGPRPKCSLLDQDNAAIAADDKHYLAVWTDTPCLRASIGDPWDFGEIGDAIARLTVFSDPKAFADSIPIPEPPSEGATGISFRSVTALLRQLRLAGRGGFRWTLRGLLNPPSLPAPFAAMQQSVLFRATQLPGQTVFPSDLVERVVFTLDAEGDPPGDQTNLPKLTGDLEGITVENEAAPLGFQRAHDTLIGLYQLLPSDIVIDLVNAAVQRGMVEVAGLGTFPASAGSPSSQLAGWVWLALATMSQFGRYEIDSPSLRNTVLCMAHWLRSGAGTIPPQSVSDQQTHGPQGSGLRPQVEGFTSLFDALFKQKAWGDVFVPGGFKLPDFDREGIYWWRTLIKPQCIDHCYSLAETADFHTTDLIRFLYLFPAPDERIPDYVRTAAELALIEFKYWWDEPPSKNPSDNSDQAEMTMWSENHQILFAQSQLLAGALFRDREFPRTGDGGSKLKTGQDHVKEGLARTERWLDHRLMFGFSEWNAPGYYNEDLPAVFNLIDFCDIASKAGASDDEGQALARIKIKAASVMDIMVFDFARFTCRGSFGVTAGRAYWEHKCYGWEQSVGNTIETLFGTRGDFTGAEPGAIALATSSYDVPEALLGIGLDRVLLDRAQPFTDRTRVSINFDDASQYGIGFDSEEDVLFWWGLEAYYDHLLDSTKRVVEAHDNLRMCGPFEPLYAIANAGWLAETMADLASATLDALQVAGGVALLALPFPVNLIAIGFEGKSIIEGVEDFFKDAWDAIKSVGRAIGHFLGLGGDDKPKIPDSALQQMLEKMLVAFNVGTVLSRANIVTHNNGDAMLSSVQNHLVGQMAFQKQPWMASLGPEACVWTQARMMSPDLGSYTTAIERFIGDIGMLHVKEAAADIIVPLVRQTGADPFGHDGPNYWTGSLALPMIVQHENAAIIAYNIPSQQRDISGAKTHAWFPKAMFDETSKQDANGGTWFFGRKDHFDPDPTTGAPVLVGSGYVALFTAIQADWTNESGNAWNDKEIMASGGSNIWVCMIGNQDQFGDFDTFCKEVQNAYLNISGVSFASVNQLECSFDIPRAASPAGTSPRLELFYDDKKGRFAGADIELDNFPRFENQYMTQMVAVGPSGSGLRPQVEHFTTRDSVGFGSTAYRITHPITGLTLDHDISAPSRSHTSQSDQTKLKVPAQRLFDGSLTVVRRPRRPSGPRPIKHPQLDLSGIRRRKP